MLESPLNHKFCCELVILKYEYSCKRQFNECILKVHQYSKMSTHEGCPSSLRPFHLFCLYVSVLDPVSVVIARKHLHIKTSRSFRIKFSI